MANEVLTIKLENCGVSYRKVMENFYNIFVDIDTKDLYIIGNSRGGHICCYRCVRDGKKKALKPTQINLDMNGYIQDITVGAFYGEDGFDDLITHIHTNITKGQISATELRDEDGFLKLLRTTSFTWRRNPRKLQRSGGSDCNIHCSDIDKDDEMAISLVNAISLVADRVSVDYWVNPEYYFNKVIDIDVKMAKVLMKELFPTMEKATQQCGFSDRMTTEVLKTVTSTISGTGYNPYDFDDIKNECAFI